MITPLCHKSIGTYWKLGNISGMEWDSQDGAGCFFFFFSHLFVGREPAWFWPGLSDAVKRLWLRIGWECWSWLIWQPCGNLRKSPQSWEPIPSVGITIWLVLWSIFYFPTSFPISWECHHPIYVNICWWFGTWMLFCQISWECHHPNWRTHIVQRGRLSTTSNVINFSRDWEWLESPKLSMVMDWGMVHRCAHDIVIPTLIHWRKGQWRQLWEL